MPFEQLVTIDRNSGDSLHLQIQKQIISMISFGILSKGMKLPSTRFLSSKLCVNRMTLALALDELESQGWLFKKERSGVFVSYNLPEINPKPLDSIEANHFQNEKCGFVIKNKADYIRHNSSYSFAHILDEGLPDSRLAPMKLLGQEYKSLLTSIGKPKLFGYASPLGDEMLRSELSIFLNRTRGLSRKMEEIAIVRGSQMALSLLSNLLIEKGDFIAVGQSNYLGADATFQHAGACLERIPVDKEGMDIDALEEACKKKTIVGVYVTSHHHHPTTATLSPERRLKLLNLAEKHSLFILEDDYDYDFHFKRSPYLPLASLDRNGHVIYLGSFTKMIAPAFRVGFISAPKELISLIEKERIMLDRQGDNVLERSIAHLLRDGVISKHINKSVKTYQNRKISLINRLEEEFASFFNFKEPNGGMAVWLESKNGVNLQKAKLNMARKNWLLPDSNHFNFFGLNDWEGIRLGFASLNENEMSEGLDALWMSLKK
ncbi:aminotransferase-like domain-containing protein [Aureibacter tunicatorum]|uniref:GntR family transcriptional regulator/MocR family aminotransferase n=1 Tax=Aureibacter tunicatorum TaxID=866807 RepID=A0AAE3XTG9_9BACT|nr:PLP-dependent aminotransferase family protein [Aureibacter tunicatorum]MDR6241561.1 GntR family transcriptional regulator/MocR family aminotransferase [Aureibacter tunicatorum]BDD07215.1 GntR family transcriptional regulator [Aureibacter tunicatorum]